MILAGDEIGRTQQGNNNAYCQDNDISWVDWRMAETNAGLLRFFQLMIAFRKRCPLLRRADFQLNGEGGFHITWHGVKRMKPDWGHESRTVAMQLTQLHDGDARDDLHFIANAYSGDLEFELPQIGNREWFRVVDTAQASPLDIAEDGQEFPLLSQESYLVKATERGDVCGEVAERMAHEAIPVVFKGPLDGYIVRGCWGLKRKFRLNRGTTK